MLKMSVLQIVNVGTSNKTFQTLMLWISLGDDVEKRE